MGNYFICTTKQRKKLILRNFERQFEGFSDEERTIYRNYVLELLRNYYESEEFHQLTKREQFAVIIVLTNT